MIAFPCVGCGKSLNVKDEFAGKRGACPHCKQPLTVPAGPKRKTDMPQPAALQTSPGAPSPPRPADLATIPQPDDTPSGPDVGGAQLDFLAPARQPGELGRLGNYRILKVLGAGGMGMVLQAEDPVLKR